MSADLGGTSWAWEEGKIRVYPGGGPVTVGNEQRSNVTSSPLGWISQPTIFFRTGVERTVKTKQGTVHSAQSRVGRTAVSGSSQRPTAGQPRVTSQEKTSWEKGRGEMCNQVSRPSSHQGCSKSTTKIAGLKAKTKEGLMGQSV